MIFEGKKKRRSKNFASDREQERGKIFIFVGRFLSYGLASPSSLNSKRVELSRNDCMCAHVFQSVFPAEFH